MHLGISSVHLGNEQCSGGISLVHWGISRFVWGYHQCIGVFPRNDIPPKYTDDFSPMN